MAINLTSLNQKAFKRNNLFLGKVMDPYLSGQRKILFEMREDKKVEDVLYNSPNYQVGESEDYFKVMDEVSLSDFLYYLGYPSELNTTDIKRLYYQVLSSTRTLYKHHEFFGAKKCERGYKCAYVYLKDPNGHGYVPFDSFASLESSILLPTKPSMQEIARSEKTFQKKMFFVR